MGEKEKKKHLGKNKNNHSTVSCWTIVCSLKSPRYCLSRWETGSFLPMVIKSYKLEILILETKCIPVSLSHHKGTPLIQNHSSDQHWAWSSYTWLIICPDQLFVEGFFSIRVSEFHKPVEKHTVSLLTEHYGSPYTPHVLWNVFSANQMWKLPTSWPLPSVGNKFMIVI